MEAKRRPCLRRGENGMGKGVVKGDKYWLDEAYIGR